MPAQDIPVTGSVRERIAWAETCSEEKGELLLMDERSVALLSRLKEAVRASRNAMALTGITDECRECEEWDGGSCCGAGLENKYDATLLLINILLGVQLPTRRSDPLGCLFLGPDGCRLLARHVICVNYLCKKIEDQVASSKVAILREKEGVELECLFVLKEHIKEKLRAYGP